MATVLKNNWIREAAMKRLHMLLRNKTERFSSGEFDNNNIDVQDLETSGLSREEIESLSMWVSGQLSGRHCLLALMEHRIKNRGVASKAKSTLSSGCVPRPLEFSMLSTSLSLPEDFLCDSGYLYESIFNRPPASVVREALQLLTAKAMEKDVGSLRADQINLALKQLRIDNLSTPSSSSGTAAGRKGDGENRENENENSVSESSKLNDENKDPDHKSSRTATVAPELVSFRLSILVELVRMHIDATNVKNLSAQIDSVGGSDAPAYYDSKCVGVDNVFSKLTLSQSEVKLSDFRNSGQTESKSAAFESSTAADAKESSRSKNDDSLCAIDLDVLDDQLDLPLQNIVDAAEKMAPEDLERTNSLLKPYVRQLSVLKATLSSQLRELEDSRAYIALGISKNATESEIKKAYHKKAVLIHPDKGGDTARFQALTKCYQEILEKRETDGLDSKVKDAVASDPKTKSESQSAQDILAGLAANLHDVKIVADTCSHIAQLNIQFQKIVQAAADKGFPTAVKDLVALFARGDDASSPSFIGDSRIKKSKKKKAMSASACTASLEELHASRDKQQEISAHLETICEKSQSLASLAMRLPGCGFRYGLATAVQPNFMRTVEAVMGSGLGSMRIISSLLTAEEQMHSCATKLRQLGGEASLNEGIHSILVEMLLTAVKSNASVMMAAADRAVESAVAAAELLSIAEALVAEAEAEAVADAATAARTKRAQEDMCEEDRVFLAAKAKKDRDEAMKKAEEEEESEAAKRKQAELDRKKVDDVEDLRVKIRNLQVQLWVQHVQALQTLNAETRGLQKSLQKQLRELVAVAADDDEKRYSVKIQSVSEAKPALPVRSSLLSLLADFIDASCNSLREAAEAEAAGCGRAGSGSGESEERLVLLVQKHLGWMRALRKAQLRLSNPSNDECNDPPGVDGEDKTHDKAAVQSSNEGSEPSIGNDEGILNKMASSLADIDDDKTDPAAPPSHEETGANLRPADGEGSSNAISPNVCGVRLALLPDYRSKALWLSVLVVPEEAVISLLSELRKRVVDCLHNLSNGDDAAAEGAADVFCNAVIDGVRAVHEEVLPST